MEITFKENIINKDEVILMDIQNKKIILILFMSYHLAKIKY